MFHLLKFRSRCIPAGVIILAIFLICLPPSGISQDTVLLPVKTLRFSIHVFQDDSGAGNFRRDAPEHIAFLHQLTDWVNRRLANLDSLTPAVPSTYVKDARVQIRLDTIFFHRDSHAWDCSEVIDSPYMRDFYVDFDTTLNYRQKFQTLPLFIGANNPVTGGHSRNIGDRGFIAVRGYYENFMRQPSDLAVDECGRNLIHELGHCLGLGHNFQGGPDGDQCDICEDNGCPLEGTSNNIMDYWPSYGYALSKCQFEQIRFFLNGGKGNISETVINDSCYNLSGPAIEVAEGETLLISDTVYAHRNIQVNGGGELRINGYLSMPGETGIQVLPGGRLVIDGGTAGNLCGDLWNGIIAGGMPGAVAASVAIIRGGMVENALTALLATGPMVTVTENSNFRNCVQALVFLTGSADSLGINGCSFRTTTKLNHYEDGITPEYFLKMEGVDKLFITGSKFVNEPGTFIFDADWMGTGISSDSRSVRIVNSEFTSLTCAVDLFSNAGSSKFEITDNQFINNRYAISTDFEGIQDVHGNRVVMQRFNSGVSTGISLRQPLRFSLKENRFESVYGGGQMAGIVITGPSTENSPVFSNRFSNLPVGIFIDGPPDIDSMLFNWAAHPGAVDRLKLGPQLRFNGFDTVLLQLAAVSDSAFGTVFGSPWKVRQEFTVPATAWRPGGYAWYHGDADMAAFHGWKTGMGGTPDHGLYWFMNRPGLAGNGPADPDPKDYSLLAPYLNRLFAMEDTVQWLGSQDVYDALTSLSKVPAAARSARLAPRWSKFGGEDKTWLREALASVAGRFVVEDSLLCSLGTYLAGKNPGDWTAVGYPADQGTQRLRSSAADPGFQFPDLSPFVFVRPVEQESGFPAFIVYPNPAKDYLLVRPKPGFSTATGWSGYLLSESGSHLKRIRITSWPDQKIDISGLPAGLYIIQLFSGNQYLGATKFIKITPR